MAQFCPVADILRSIPDRCGPVPDLSARRMSGSRRRQRGDFVELSGLQDIPDRSKRASIS
jgi:hypothetical protein